MIRLVVRAVRRTGFLVNEYPVASSSSSRAVCRCTIAGPHISNARRVHECVSRTIGVTTREVAIGNDNIARSRACTHCSRTIVVRRTLSNSCQHAGSILLTLGVTPRPVSALDGQEDNHEQQARDGQDEDDFDKGKSLVPL